MKRLFFILLIVPLVLISGCSDKHQDDRLKVIFETDIGNDVDDALALDMLYKYVEWGQVDLLAVMINKDAPAPAEYMDIMNTSERMGDFIINISQDLERAFISE